MLSAYLFRKLAKRLKLFNTNATIESSISKREKKQNDDANNR